jgi:hypothetical protein
MVVAWLLLLTAGMRGAYDGLLDQNIPIHL